MKFSVSNAAIAALALALGASAAGPTRTTTNTVLGRRGGGDAVAPAAVAQRSEEPVETLQVIALTTKLEHPDSDQECTISDSLESGSESRTYSVKSGDTSCHGLLAGDEATGLGCLDHGRGECSSDPLGDVSSGYLHTNCKMHYETDCSDEGKGGEYEPEAPGVMSCVNADDGKSFQAFSCS